MSNNPSNESALVCNSSDCQWRCCAVTIIWSNPNPGEIEIKFGSNGLIWVMWWKIVPEGRGVLQAGYKVPEDWFPAGRRGFLSPWKQISELVSLQGPFHCYGYVMHVETSLLTSSFVFTYQLAKVMERGNRMTEHPPFWLAFGLHRRGIPVNWNTNPTVSLPHVPICAACQEFPCKPGCIFVKAIDRFDGVPVLHMPALTFCFHWNGRVSVQRCRYLLFLVPFSLRHEKGMRGFNAQLGNFDNKMLHPPVKGNDIDTRTWSGNGASLFWTNRPLGLNTEAANVMGDFCLVIEEFGRALSR